MWDTAKAVLRGKIITMLIFKKKISMEYYSATKKMKSYYLQ